MKKRKDTVGDLGNVGLLYNTSSLNMEAVDAISHLSGGYTTPINHSRGPLITRLPIPAVYFGIPI